MAEGIGCGGASGGDGAAAGAGGAGAAGGCAGAATEAGGGTAGDAAGGVDDVELVPPALMTAAAADGAVKLARGSNGVWNRPAGVDEKEIASC